jgi:hypothetical protein
LACSFSARFLVASISAFEDDGMPQGAVTRSRPSVRHLEGGHLMADEKNPAQKAYGDVAPALADLSDRGFSVRSGSAQVFPSATAA